MNHQMTKFNRPSSDPIDIINTTRIDTGGKGGRGVKSSSPFCPLQVFLLLLVGITIK